MSKKHDLRAQRIGTVINITSNRQEKSLAQAMEEVCKRLGTKFPALGLHHQRQWLLADVVTGLKKHFPDVDFHYYFQSSAMRPDGGILSVLDKSGEHYPILIAEKKNQGTNDLRKAEGKTPQAKGNAIERLGKNVIGLRAAFLNESIFPFVCFGDGCDFADGSSILDRVVTIAMFGHLNRENVQNLGPSGVFNRGSFYFRVAEWTAQEMADRCYSVAEKAIYYYFSKHGEGAFI